MTRILAVNGAYRDGGITDQTVAAMAGTLQSAGAEVDIVLLRDSPIGFCRNCRECTQQPGEAPGRCVQQDDMQALIENIEQADGYILASPTNAGSVTALFKRFMERLIVYTYWPWEADAPVYRKQHAPGKSAVLVSSCAAPGMLGRWLYATRGQLKATARTIGAAPVGILFTGSIAKAPRPVLPQQVHRRVGALADRLLRACS